MQYIIFGANGYIGSYIYDRMLAEGMRVTGTVHHAGGNRNACIKYDILKDSVTDITCSIYDEKKLAVICIAYSNINFCFENYKQAYFLNVVKTKELIHILSENGYQVIFLSSDNVFDGTSGNYVECSKKNAINKYGQMKAEMEDYLLENEKNACIFRISKVVSAGSEEQNILYELDRQALKGSVKCIKGNRLSFVAMEDIYQSCLLAAERDLHGVFNIVGDRSFSRAEFASEFYKKLGKESIEIEECGAEAFNLKDGRPLDISMSNLKFKQATGYRFLPVETVMDQYIANRIS